MRITAWTRIYNEVTMDPETEKAIRRLERYHVGAPRTLVIGVILYIFLGAAALVVFVEGVRFLDYLWRLL